MINFSSLYAIKETQHGDLVVASFMNTASFVWFVRGVIVFAGVPEATFSGIIRPQPAWIYMLPFPITLALTAITLFLVSRKPAFNIVFGLPMCLLGVAMVTVHNYTTGDVSATSQLLYVPCIVQAAHFLRLPGAVLVTSLAVFSNSFVLYTNDTPRQFTTDSFGTAVPMLLMAFVLVAMAEAEAQRTEAIKLLAYTDILTGLQNRGMLEQVITDLSARLTPRTSIAMALIDIDHFKEINDTFGHHVGDNVLIATSKNMRAVFQNGETLIRMGGDELAVLFPNATSSDAAQKIKSFVDCSPSTIEGTEKRASFSIGVAAYPEHVSDLGELYAKADSALYVAKETGRNRIVISEHDDEPIMGMS